MSQQHRERVDKGLKDLQSIMSGGSENKSTTPRAIQTKQDKQFEETKRLLMVASRLESAANVLEDCTKIFCNKESSRFLLSKSSQHVKRYIIPLLRHAAESLNDVSTTVAPIASVTYAHNRTENERNIDVVDESNTQISPDLQLVCDYLYEEERRKRSDAHKITPPKKKLRISSPTSSAISHSDTNNIHLPPPVNGHQYRKPEVVNILLSYKKCSNAMGLAIRKMIELKYVPVCE
jgi:hypothetical protein